ncbi:hypothetical protein KEM52_004671 [Ascosphaera acerosa]|nr:hypothetical protein KEM52_004671 [Ascosphaera acerosa]
MRRSVLLFGIACVLALTYLLYCFSTLIALLLEDCAADAIHRSELPSQNSSLIDTRPQLIPKIIHQTYKNETIPSVWQDAQKSCIQLHDDYEYILWTDAKAESFIAKEYPWFLETFRTYEYPIQRADSIRYFVLAHYGGIYIDLDDGCNRRLDPLLAYPAWLRRTTPTGISNDAMGSVPQHPFFLHVIDSLQAYNRKWMLPYITVMYSTGPLFLSVIWKQWMSHRDPDESHRVRVLMKDEYNRHSWSFFTYHKGSSWHGKDAQLIFWMGQNWMLLTVLGTTLVLAVGYVAYKCYTKVVALKGCAAVPWPCSRIATIFTRSTSSAAKEAQYSPLPATGRPLTPSEYGHDDPKFFDDDEPRGRRRSLGNSAAFGTSQYDEKSGVSINSNAFTYALTPTVSSTSHGPAGLPEYNGLLHPSQSPADDSDAPATASNAYSLRSQRSLSRLRLPSLGSFLPRRLSRTRDLSPATQRPRSSGSTVSMADAQAAEAATCGLTGEDVEAQAPLTRWPSHVNGQRSVIDAREEWAQQQDQSRQRSTQG